MSDKTDRRAKLAVLKVIRNGKSKKQVMREHKYNSAQLNEKLEMDLIEVIGKYCGDLKMVEALGILTLVEDEVKTWI